MPPPRRAAGSRATALPGLVLALILAVVPAVAQNTTPSSLAVLADQVAALFPTINGEVLEAQGSTLTLSLGRRDGALVGIELAVYREGRELRHPRTGEVLGRAEQAVGRVMLEQVLEAYSTGKLTHGGDVQPGDKVRVSAGKIKLTLLPLVDGVKDTQAEAATHELIENLTRTGRFQVGLGDAIGVWLTQQGVSRPDILEGRGLQAAGERFKLEHLLVVQYQRVQSKPYMDVRLFTFPGVTPLMSTAMFVPPPRAASTKGGDFSSGKNRDSQTPANQKPFLLRILTGELDAGAYSSGESSIPLRELVKFPFVVTAMDVAVAPVDKVARLAIADTDRIYLYRIVDGKLEAEWTFKADARGRIFSVQLADLDGDGVLEVVANRYHPNPSITMTSFILTTREQKPVRLVDNISEILLAVDTEGNGVKRTLWGQDWAQGSFFKKGQATRYTIRDGKLVTDRAVRVSASFRATGATMTNIAGKEVRALAFVDEWSRLQITMEGEEMWRSSAPVGGGIPKLVVETQIERGGRNFLYQPEPWPVAIDLDGDGIDEVVVPQNQIPGRIAVAYKGPAGYRFQTVNSGFEGTVTALGAIRGEGTGPSLVLAVARYYGVLSSTGETSVVMTLPE
jgi:hypothetical protein